MDLTDQLLIKYRYKSSCVRVLDYSVPGKALLLEFDWKEKFFKNGSQISAREFRKSLPRGAYENISLGFYPRQYQIYKGGGGDRRIINGISVARLEYGQMVEVGCFHQLPPPLDRLPQNLQPIAIRAMVVGLSMLIVGGFYLLGSFILQRKFTL
jgi:hypothetical protein